MQREVSFSLISSVHIGNDRRESVWIFQIGIEVNLSSQQSAVLRTQREELDLLLLPLDRLAVVGLDVEVPILLGGVSTRLLSKAEDEEAFARSIDSDTILRILLNLCTSVSSMWQSLGVLSSPGAFDEDVLPGFGGRVVSANVYFIELLAEVAPFHPEDAIVGEDLLATQILDSLRPELGVVGPVSFPFALTPGVSEADQVEAVNFDHLEDTVCMALDDATIRLGSVSIRMARTTCSEEDVVVL